MDKMGERIPAVVRPEFLVSEDKAGEAEESNNPFSVNPLYLQFVHERDAGLTKSNWKEYKAEYLARKGVK